MIKFDEIFKYSDINIFVGIFRGQEDPATWAPQVGNSWRTTGDISDNWNRYNLFFLI